MGEKFNIESQTVHFRIAMKAPSVDMLKAVNAQKWRVSSVGKRTSSSRRNSSSSGNGIGNGIGSGSSLQLRWRKRKRLLSKTTIVSLTFFLVLGTRIQPSSSRDEIFKEKGKRIFFLIHQFVATRPGFSERILLPLSKKFNISPIFPTIFFAKSLGKLLEN